MYIEEIRDTAKKMSIARNVLEALPHWFGIAQSTEEYITESGTMLLWAAIEEDDYIGFVALKQHTEDAAEVYVMGIKETYHRKGIGKALMEKCFEFCKEEGISFLQVKTLDEAHPDPYYAKTRAFYKRMGFKKLEVLLPLWGACNPCLMMIQYIDAKEVNK